GREGHVDVFTVGDRVAPAAPGDGDGAGEAVEREAVVVAAAGELGRLDAGEADGGAGRTADVAVVGQVHVVVRLGDERVGAAATVDREDPFDPAADGEAVAAGAADE